jgi:putative transposase
LAARPRVHVHHTPTYASWLKQVERWFALLTQRQIRRGSFASAKELIAKIDAFVDVCNTKARPLVWTATSEAILGKIERLCKAINGAGHSEPLKKPLGPLGDTKSRAIASAIRGFISG